LDIIPQGGEMFFRTWLYISSIVAGIIFIVLGIYYLKYDPDSWVRSSTTWIEFPEWFTYLYAGAFFIIGAIVVKWLVP